VCLAALLLDEPALCEDVAQKACIRAAAAKGGLRDPDASLAYLRRTVVNLSRSAMRGPGEGSA
jgi:DNA-directed RNA polymerase specialized sigma24 family protein